MRHAQSRTPRVNRTWDTLAQPLDRVSTQPTVLSIAEAQRLLGVPLPPSYLATLLRCRSPLRVWDLLWIGARVTSLDDLVRMTLAARDDAASPLPKFLVAFHEQRSFLYCFDTRYPDGQGEYPLIAWDRDEGPEQLRELFPEAYSFIAWLEDEVGVV